MNVLLISLQNCFWGIKLYTYDFVEMGVERSELCACFYLMQQVLSYQLSG